MNPPVSVATAGTFWARLSAHGDRPAIVTPDGIVTYADLADRVAAVRHELGTIRRLVVIEGASCVDTVVAYLAALAGGHPAVLVPSADAVASYDADVVIRGGSLQQVRPGTIHQLHPELALMLSTSGSTGSPKLVRLSYDNLASNATAIASYLQIRGSDVAPTTLPLHYCYGLSVLNSHLAVGAAIMLTDESVTSDGFWAAFRAAGCTSLAGVPYTFELLDRIGFAELDLPTLRYLTQAGGRLEPDAVRRYAELGQQRGYDLFVMYGATEATARMAYLPPDLTVSCAGAIGVPIPGGTLSVADDGELVYTGVNVMLGYAESRVDLARGRDVHELRTGDLGRRRPDGLFEVTGRKARIAKVFGLRIDLDRIEQLLAVDGVMVRCADGGDRVVAAVDVSARPACADDIRGRVALASGLPDCSVHVLPMSGVPLLPSGKPDYAAIAEAAAACPPERRCATTGADLTALYAQVLRCEEVTPDDSFVSLRGDSLSYVEMSMRLEEALGVLPPSWHATPIRDLVPSTGRRAGGRSIETNVVLRAVAIVLIVGSHADLFALMGGAHVLLAVAGYNFGRFVLVGSSRGERVKRVLGSVARLALPCVVWLAVAAPLATDVTWRNVLLLNGVLGTSDWSDPWRYWFIEAVVYIFLWLAALSALPWFDRAERRWPFWLPLALAVTALLTRYDVVGARTGVEEYRAHVIVWVFALGWATVKAQTSLHRLLVSALVVATVPGFFELHARTAIVVVGMLLLVWVRSVRVPAVLATPVGVLASASLSIYLVHWQVYPRIEDAGHHLLATLASLVVGVALWWAVSRLTDHRPGLSLRSPGEPGRLSKPRACELASRSDGRIEIWAILLARVVSRLASLRTSTT